MFGLGRTRNGIWTADHREKTFLRPSNVLQQKQTQNTSCWQEKYWILRDRLAYPSPYCQTSDQVKLNPFNNKDTIIHTFP